VRKYPPCPGILAILPFCVVGYGFLSAVSLSFLIRNPNKMCHFIWRAAGGKARPFLAQSVVLAPVRAGAIPIPDKIVAILSGIGIMVRESFHLRTRAE
jgi:hypothetical protein